MPKNKVQPPPERSRAEFLVRYATYDKCGAKLGAMTRQHCFRCPDCRTAAPLTVQRWVLKLYRIPSGKHLTSLTAATAANSTKRPQPVRFCAIDLRGQDKTGLR